MKTYKPEIWKKAVEEASTCDILIAIGTSLVVETANELPFIAKDHGAKLTLSKWKLWK